ncbi:interferon-induced 35 kDa protein [Xyrichtys novacula]|uniref:Interferon-induced 35 kDa protein n=1 Tax=Xyrichtys novacula TaxID=13765 RepID=A0AAV1GRZ1_XYRNO|nr:interferon-induced 35 kDa protein [Xyrichtys novacula]
MSDEEFSLVMADQKPSEDSLEAIEALTNKLKKQHEQLLQDQKELATCRDDLQDRAKKFKERTKKLSQDLKEDEDSHKEEIRKEKAKVALLKEEEIDLMKHIEEVEAALQEEEAKYEHMKQQTDVFSAVPEKNMVFKGLTGVEGDSQFEMKPHIIYPMEGGTALITFEEEKVARNIVDMKEHCVNLGGECFITVGARPVQLLTPSLVEIQSEVSPRCILISNLPRMDTEPLLNKLEIHFSKTKNGGGEVEDREFLPDSGTVVITFLKSDFARGLAETEFHDVALLPRGKGHRVRVTPFLNGTVTKFKTKMRVCPRTVLLTGIPAVMERETLQDLLEIHFQKSGNSGGEIEAFLYNPQGHKTSALFTGVSEKKQEE